MSVGRTLYHNCRVHEGRFSRAGRADHLRARPDCVLVEDGVIRAVGVASEIRRSCGPHEAIDLKGMTVIPGFIDSHVHFVPTGLHAAQLDVSKCRTLDELLTSIGRAGCSGVRTQDDERPLKAYGFDETKLAEKRGPTREELDLVCPGRPVCVSRVDGHSANVNTAMLRMAGLEPGQEGVVLGDAGLPSGTVRGEANTRLRSFLNSLVDDEDRRAAVRLAADAAARAGITTVCALEGGPLHNERDVYVLEEMKDDLNVNVITFFQTTDVDLVLELGYPRIGGCITLDGSFGSRTAAVSEPYEDDPSSTGITYFSDEELLAFVRRAHRAGLQIAVHAIGDRAIGQMLEALARVQQECPRQDARHRIEHFQLATPAQTELAVRLGVVVSGQPAFEHYWGGDSGMYRARLGLERARRMNDFRALLNRGVALAFGSDSPVTPMDPMLGIRTAVRPPHPHKGISIYAALDGFTIWGAWAAFEESRRGTLEPGKIADMVALTGDPLEEGEGALEDVRVAMTVCRGRVAFVEERLFV